MEFEQLDKIEILDNIYLSSKLVEHGNLKPAYGYILTKNNKTIGFYGDSKYCKAVEEIVIESDISVIDMSLPADGNNAHMGLNDIEKLCDKYKDKKIIGTHMHDITRKIANDKNIDNLIIPNDGITIDI